MRKLIAAAMVLLVLALGVVNFPLIQSVVTGTPSLGSKDRDSLSSSPSPTPQEAGTGSTATSSHDAVASFSTEEAAAVLARLKPRPSQGSVGAHEVPVQLPRKISIPSIAVETGFEHVGLLPDGAMDVPKDPNLVAWYRLGPRPGEAGNAVVAGHVDWGGKTAAFWRLSDLKPGDLVEITAVDERKYQFVMQWQRWYDANDAPVAELFGGTEGSALTLITCGGVFDQKTRQYLSRLVVRSVRR